MRIARASGQLALLDVAPVFQIKKNAQARNAYGCAAQEIVCRALDLDSIAINGNCTHCFDAEGKGSERGKFFEIKSVYRTSKIPIYAWRIKKEADAGVPLKYAILAHRVKGESDGSRIFQTFAARGLEILLIDAARVHEAALREPLQTIKSVENPDPEAPRMGYNRKGYRDGYHNVPMKVLRELCREAGEIRFELYGINFQIALHGS